MGLEQRRTSGNLIGGSRLVVPGQNIYNVKKFPNSFNFKKGSNRELIREVAPLKPIPIPPQDILDALLVDSTTYFIPGPNEYIRYVE